MVFDKGSANGSTERVGPRGGFEFELSRRQNGVCMRRISLSQNASRVEQWVVFAGPDAFKAWCEEDPVMHAEPQLYLELIRVGLDLFAKEVGA